MQKKDIPDAGCSPQDALRRMFDARGNRKSRSENQESRTEGVPFSSNYVRLPGREWVIVGIIFAAIFCLAPALWERFEKFEPGPDYRLPYELSSDYWLYNR